MGASSPITKVMSKALYALSFMALCGVILVIHEQTNTESVKSPEYSEDPFLASVEKHVVATAQRRLKKTFHKIASDKHISEARKAIKAALLDADDSNQFSIKKAEAERMAAVEVEDAPKMKVAKKVSHKTHKKQYTWDELQNGNAAEVEKHDASQKMSKSLMNNLKSAPKVDKAEVEADDETVMVSADDQVKEVAQIEEKKEAAKAAKEETTKEEEKEEDTTDDEEEDAADDDEEEEVQETPSKKKVEAPKKKKVEAEADDETPPKKVEAEADDEVEEESFTEEAPQQPQDTVKDEEQDPVADDDYEDDGEDYENMA